VINARLSSESEASMTCLSTTPSGAHGVDRVKSTPGDVRTGRRELFAEPDVPGGELPENGPRNVLV
jgi:hypothetical protein